MQNKFVLDTSYVSSLVLESDVNHNKATKIYENLANDSNLYIPVTVVMELLVGIKRLAKGKIKKLLNFLDMLNPEIIYNDNNFVDEYTDFVIQHRSLLTAIDLSIIVTAKMLNAKIITFDKKLGRFRNKF